MRRAWGQIVTFHVRAINLRASSRDFTNFHTYRPASLFSRSGSI